MSPLEAPTHPMYSHELLSSIVQSPRTVTNAFNFRVSSERIGKLSINSSSLTVSHVNSLTSEPIGETYSYLGPRTTNYDNTASAAIIKRNAQQTTTTLPETTNPLPPLFFFFLLLVLRLFFLLFVLCLFLPLRVLRLERTQTTMPYRPLLGL